MRLRHRPGADRDQRSGGRPRGTGLAELAGPGPAIELTDDPDLHLLVDGVRVDASEVRDCCHAFDIDAAGAALRIASRADAPAELGLSHEQRRLGVAVQRIVLRAPGLTIELDAASPSLRQGFHGYEADDGLRWTDGDAALPPALAAACAVRAGTHRAPPGRQHMLPPDHAGDPWGKARARRLSQLAKPARAPHEGAPRCLGQESDEHDSCGPARCPWCPRRLCRAATAQAARAAAQAT